ncbi:MAG: chemotaxis protein CheW [Cyanobacteriota bacterium]|nr:chemotaxis protein CheW [Cyanobacteriota bacterium]
MHDESEVGKFIVFKIADYLMALPISEVLKVVNCSSITSRELRTMGVIQLGRQMIRILDWHEELTSGNLAQSLDNYPFLVITQGREGELCGISVDEPPNLLELPLEMLRTLPNSERHTNRALTMASHVAVISQEKVTTTIFMLDVNRLVNTAINESYPLSLKPASAR